MTTRVRIIVTSVVILTLIASMSGLSTVPAEAVKGNVPGAPFGVLLTNTLQSFDADGGGPPYNGAGDKPVSSGYTFTVRSTAALTPAGNSVTVTFPAGTDFSAANALGANYQVWDPAAGAFKNATSVLIDTTTNPSAPAVTMTFGGLVAPIAAESNITVRIGEGAGIRNPATAGAALKLRARINSSADVTEAVSDSYAVGPSVVTSPRNPGEAAEFTIKFIAPNDLDANEGSIIITFDKDVGFPDSAAISASSVSLRADKISNVVGSAAPNRTARLVDAPSVTMVGPDRQQREVTIRVPDMDVATNATGEQGIAAGATVTVTFTAASSLRNPNKGATAFQQPAFTRDILQVRTTDATGGGLPGSDRQVFLHTPRIVRMSTAEGGRNESVTVTGKGFEEGATVVVFVDANGDGAKQIAESEVGRAVVGTDNAFSATFAVSSAFKVGAAGNPVQVVDGQGNSACRFAIGPGSAGICLEDGPNFKLKGKLTVSPSSGNVGVAINLTLVDWEAVNVPIDAITIGGVNVDFTGTTVPSSGGLTMRLTIPNDAATGIQTIRVRTGQVSEGTPFTVGGGSLRLSVPRAVPNHEITLSGSGFTSGGNARICESAITIGGEQATLRRGSVDGSGPPCGGGVSYVNVTSGGTFVATIIIPVTSTTLQENTYELKVSDSSGRTSSTQLELVKRELRVTPAVSGLRSRLTISGSGYPAENFDSPNAPQITIDYECGGLCQRSASAQVNASGAFTVSMEVPSRAPIPSKNTVRATITSGSTTAVDTVIHEILGPKVQLDLESAAPGTLITVTGSGFQPFAAVTAIQIGGLGILGTNTFNTDGSGRFVATNILVPDLDPGTHSLLARVGSGGNQTTANAIFQVLRKEAPAAVAVPTAIGLAGVGDNLVRAFSFNNARKEWTFYDPRPEARDLNTITQMVAGQAYWIKVNGNQTVTLNGKERSLTCVNPGGPQEDCWNIIVW